MLPMKICRLHIHTLSKL